MAGICRRDNTILEQAQELLKTFDDLPDADKWSAPFPMGVFGTLRLGNGNHHLMGQKDMGQERKSLPKDQHEIAGYYRSCRGRMPYQSHHRAFMPNFVALGLSIKHKPNASAVFEIFTYKPEDWPGMIPAVDRLEGFSTGRPGYQHGYHRTLTWLHVLPDDYENDWFDSRSWCGERDLQIPPDEWDKYKRVPCWVYSSVHENLLNTELDTSPILWYGDGVVSDSSWFDDD